MRSLGAGTPSGKDALAGSPSATEEHGTGAGVEGMGEEPAKVSDVSALGRRYTPLEGGLSRLRGPEEEADPCYPPA